MRSWFSKLKQSQLEALDFSDLYTDVHSHLIPNIDDGSKSLEESLLIINSLREMGFKKLITTPHVMSDCYKNDGEIISSGLLSLKNAILKEKIDIEIEAAAEYYLDFDFQEKIGKEEFLTFGNKYILVELSFLSRPDYLQDILFNLQLNGYIIVLAHPERYQYLSMKDYEQLAGRGVLLQLNLLSLVGYYSDNIKKKSEFLIDQELISLAGTDCHNMKHAESLKRCFNSKYWHKLMSSGNLLNSTL